MKYLLMLLLTGLLALPAMAAELAWSVDALDGPNRSASERTCAELYGDISALLATLDPNEPQLLDDKRYQYASAIGTFFRPAYAVLWIYAYEDFTAPPRNRHILQRVDALRVASARKQCFVR